jgi:hypothetical protein
LAVSDHVAPTCQGESAATSLPVVKHFADGVNYNAGLVERNIFGTVAREYLLGVGG